MIAPSGKYAVLWKKGSTEWITLRGAKVKSTVKGSAHIGAPIPLPELAVKFSGHIEVLNQEGTPIRISPFSPSKIPGWISNNIAVNYL